MNPNLQSANNTEQRPLWVLFFYPLPYGRGFILSERGGIMTERQRKFAECYAKSGNTVQSALEAGYSENYANARAHELLENVGVMALIKEISDKISSERILTATQRQEILSDIARSTAQLSADRIRAIDTLNRMTGEYTVKTELSGGVGVTIIDDIPLE